MPKTDPDFQNTLVYYAAKSKPSKYVDRTTQEVDEFMPVPTTVPKTVPTTTPKTLNPGSKGGNTIFVPDAPIVTQSSNSSVYRGSPWQSGSFGVNLPSGFGPAANPKGLKVLVLNGGAGEGAGAKLAFVLKRLGFHCARGYQLSFAHYNKEDIIYYDRGRGQEYVAKSNPTRRPK